jgi:hypothetical protein
MDGSMIDGSMIDGSMIDGGMMCMPVSDSPFQVLSFAAPLPKHPEFESESGLLQSAKAKE